jgi:hypothetical protein
VTVIKREQQGPIRTTIEAHNGALFLYKASIRNKMVRAALKAAGVHWLNVYLVRRFKSDYQRVFGYPAITKRYAQRKAKLLGSVQPYQGFRRIGDMSKMVNAALTGARASAVATQTKGFIRITVPYGHPIRPEYSQAFRNVPGGEIIALAATVGRALAAEIAGNPLTEANRKKEPKPRVVGGNGKTRGTGSAPRRAA